MNKNIKKLMLTKAYVINYLKDYYNRNKKIPKSKPYFSRKIKATNFFSYIKF